MNPEAWQILGLDPSTPVLQVRQRFRQLALQHHPDKGGSQYIFNQIKEAYKDILTFHQSLNQKQPYDLRSNSKAALKQQQKQTYRGQLDPNNLNMDKFNNFFVQHRLNDPLDHGYGHLMEVSSHHREDESIVAKSKIQHFPDQQLILYQAPQEVFGCSANVENLGDDNKNFTTPWNSKVQFTDYIEAHSKPVDREIIPARESFNSIDHLEAERKKSLKATEKEKKRLAKIEKEKERQERHRMKRLHKKEQQMTSNYQKIQNLLGFGQWRS